MISSWKLPRLDHVGLPMLVGLILAMSPVQAQQPAINAPTVPQTLNLQTLLTSDQVILESVADPVWQLKARPGRIYVLLPIELGEVAQPTELNKPAIDLGASRFVAWYLPATIENQTQADGKPVALPEQTSQMDPAQHQTFIDRLMLTDTPLASRLQPDVDARDDSADSARSRNQTRRTLPDQASRLTRDLVVQPDGAIIWEMERAIPGGEIPEGEQPYVLKMRPDLLRDKRPVREPRPKRQPNEDARTYRAKIQELDGKYRDAMRDYRELDQSVRSLPDEFALPSVTQVWAVFELRDAIRILKIEGDAPLPWEINFTDFKKLRDLTKTPPSSPAADTGFTLSNEQLDAVTLFDQILNDSEPLSFYAVAMVLEKMNIIADVESDDPLFKLLSRIIAGSSSPARSIVVEQLAAQLPPTEATSSLLALAADRITAEEQWAILRGMLQGSLADQASQQLCVDTANRVLASSDGPDVMEVLARLVGKARGDAALQKVFAAGIDFAAMPDDRRQQAMRFVARYAGVQPLAADWLQLNLLANPATVVATLDQLSKLRQNEADWLLTPWPIRNQTDGLLAQLNQDTAIEGAYEKAWRVLPGFALPTPDPRQRRKTQESPEPDRIGLIVEAGLATKPTPSTLVPFLVAQDVAVNTTRSQSSQALLPITTALMQVVMQADDLGTKQAAAALLGSGRPIDEAIIALPADQREQFIRRLWVAGASTPIADVKDTPLMLSLVHDDNAAKVIGKLLAEPVEDEALPSLDVIAQVPGDDAQMFALTRKEDDALRSALVAAMVHMAGGDEKAARVLAERFVLLPDQTEEGRRQFWDRTRENLAMKTITDAAGRYALTLRIAPAPPEAPEASEGATESTAETSEVAPQAPAFETYQLGVVGLLVEGTNVKLSNGLVLTPVLETASLTIQEPGALKLFEVDGVAELPLEQAQTPWSLRIQKDGSWQGGTTIPDRGEVELIMKRAD